MNEDKLQTAINKGYEAERALDDDAWSQAFQTLHDGIVDRWRISEGLSAEDRERLWICLSLLDKLKSTLRRAVSEGGMARQELDFLISQQRAA